MSRLSRVSVFLIFLPFVFLAFVSCSVDNSVGYRNIVSILGGIWEFEIEDDYTFDESQVDITRGMARLKLVGQFSSNQEYNRGMHSGTCAISDTLKMQSLFSCETGADVGTTALFPDKNADLIGHWGFDDNFNDSSSSGNHCTPVGNPTISPLAKVQQNSLFLDSALRYLDCGDSESLRVSTEVTISAWVKPTNLAIATEQAIVNKEGEYEVVLKTDTTGTIQVAIANTSPGWAYIDTGYAPKENEWFHLSLVYDSTLGSDQLKFFVNGDLYFKRDASGPITDAPGHLTVNNLYIGSRQNSTASRYFDGYLDEVSIYQTAFSDTEVLNLYQSQRGTLAGDTSLNASWTPRYSALVGYWKMDGTWQDSSGNGNHGTAIGAATFSTDKRVGSQAGAFDGDGGYIDIADSSELDLTNNLSISAWVKLNGYSADNNYPRPLSKGNSTTTNGAYSLLVTDPGNSKVSCVAITGGVLKEVVYSTGVENDLNWHHYGCSFNGTEFKIYVDGHLVATLVETFTIDQTADSLNIGSGANGQRDFNGYVDDVAIWNAALTSSEMKTIYSRQKQKYAGHYDSPVIDLGVPGEWTNFDVSSALPFGKEIDAQGIESLSDYSLATGSLSDGLIGLWHFNESLWDQSVGEVRDSSPLNNHGQSFLGDSISKNCLFANCGGFTGTNANGVNISTTGGLDIDPNSDFSFSLWIKPDMSYDRPGAGFTSPVYFRTSGGYNVSLWLMDVADGSKGQVRFYRYNGSAVSNAQSGVGKITGDKFQHIVGVKNGTTISLYVDGELVDSSPDISFTAQTTDLLQLGHNNYQGEIDEVAIWSRALTDGSSGGSDEIQELYRRGANRIKYQVKSCVDSSCECKSFNNAPVGSASDCDGDGIPNATDSDDIFKAEFSGPGGNGVTAFSELFNRDSGDMAFTCNANTTDTDNDICVDDEITLSGESKAASPSFSFSDFPSSARPTDNRYFQYRVMMEAEENTACGGEPCLPELTSIEVGPIGRYYSGSPGIVNKSSHPIDKALDNLQVSASSGCELTYQISNDGSTFYYWNGSSWVAGSNSSSQAMSLETLNSNIKSFTDHIGLGDFYFRSYLGNSNFGECEIDRVQIIKARR